MLREIRAAERFAIATHEHPDGDALGSLVAMQGVLRALGKDSVIVIAPEEFPLPQEYRFFALDGLATAPPADLDQRTVIFLDCGNLDRNPLAALRDAEPLLNIDHHHDNTRFGTVNHVVEDASCTAEIIWDLLGDLGVELTPQIAEALYVGLVTDTGRFSYENTTPRAHRMAAELISAGVDVARSHRQIYEGVPLEKLELLARALASIQRFDDGRVTVAMLRGEDFTRDRRARQPLRGHHRPAAHGRRHEGRGADPRGQGRRRSQGLAAGDRRRGRRLGDRAGVRRRRPPPRCRLLERPRGRRADLRDPRARLTDGIVLADKPAGITSHDVVARARRALGTRRVGHAGTLDPFATGLVIVLVGRATRLARYFVELPKTYEVVARLGARSSTGRSGGRDRARPARCPTSSSLPLGVVRQRPPAHSAVKIDGERAYARARRGEEVVTAEREVTVYESELRWRRDDLAGASLRLLGRDLRALAGRRARRAYCVELRRTRDRAVRGRRRAGRARARPSC